MKQRVDVALAARSYSIEIGAGLLAELAFDHALPPASKLVLISDDHVARHWLEPIREALAGRLSHSVVLPAGEQQKTLANAEHIWTELAKIKAGRDVLLLALGGGVIGDLTGFAAANWMRGVRFVQIPTTLLAQVDSSVGGKTGVNLPSGKNLVGAFHQPSQVLIDINTLSTLPDRELRAGLAEVVKYGMILDAGFFTWLEDHADALLQREPQALIHAITASCRHKAEIVRRDEFEQNERAWLNFGHTFGHAIETLTGYTELLHGEAVAIGMVLATRLSHRLGMLEDEVPNRLEGLLRHLGLPVARPDHCRPGAILDAMRLDKKNQAGQLRLILLQALGQATMRSDIANAVVRELLESSR